VNVPDFHLLAQLAECLSGSGLQADWTSLCKDKTSSEYQAELQHCIDQLMEVGRYQQGLDFVTLVGLPKESVVIAQVSITYALCECYRPQQFFLSSWLQLINRAA
jgi:hypothetical protein